MNKYFAFIATVFISFALFGTMDDENPGEQENTKTAYKYGHDFPDVKI